jgi:hypothetical protein
MAINKNHEFEELDGIKCGIVEKNVSATRVDFLKKLLTLNGFEVVVVPSPAPKAAAAPAPAATENASTETVATVPVVEAPSTFTVGVTDYTFNATNAIFGRLLKTQNGHVVTQAYWLQKEAESHDEVPYYDFK